MTYRLPSLSYDYAALEPHYSAHLLELHHSKHHAAYVKGLNETLQRLAQARSEKNFESLVGLEKALAFHLSGHVMHSLLWKNLSPDAVHKPNGDLARAIDACFGSFESMRLQLTWATSTVQGSGWGTLAWEPVGKRLLVEQVYDHQGNIGSGTVPLLVIDAWEHAYYLQFENRKEDYLKSLWNVLDWRAAEQRFERAEDFELL